MIGQIPNPILATTADKETGRIKTEDGSTAFSLGREFRAFKELSIVSGATYVIKVVVPFDIDVTQLVVNVDAGALRVSTVVGGTEGGTFTTIGPIIPKNNRSDRPAPFYTAQVQALGGGTITGGTEIDLARLNSGKSANAQTVGGSIHDKRGIATGNYYFKFQNTSNETATGVFYANWSEI